MIDAQSARIEWAERVARKAREMLIIARVTRDDEFRNELVSCARRLDEQHVRIVAGAGNVRSFPSPEARRAQDGPQLKSRPQAQARPQPQLRCRTHEENARRFPMPLIAMAR